MLTIVFDFYAIVWSVGMVIFYWTKRGTDFFNNVDVVIPQKCK